MNRFLPFKIIAISFFLAFVSCSKDNDSEPVTAIKVTTENFSKTIDENPTDGQLIGTVAGSTNEGSITFSVIDQTPAGAFAIDAATGELKVADPTLYNFETTPIIIGSVKVANGPLFEIAEITITLNDAAEDRVYEGNIYLTSQDEINQFGDAGYTHVKGFVYIGTDAYNDIHDLSPLVNLEKIDYYLYIEYCQSLITIDGFNNLTEVAGISISDNYYLTSITGFKNLKNLSGGFHLVSDFRLTDISGFSNLEYIGKTGDLGNLKLTDLSGLNKLKYVGESLSVFYNNYLLNIDGLSNLQNLGSLVIVNNDKLRTLNGLSSVQATLKKLEIGYNPLLTDITGIHNIDVTVRVNINHNPRLNNLQALSKITSLTQIVIEGNASMINLRGLENLSNVTDYVNIKSNNSLESLEGLEALDLIGGNMEILYNLALKDFCGLRDFMTNGTVGYLYIDRNSYNPTKQDIIEGNCSI